MFDRRSLLKSAGATAALLALTPYARAAGAGSAEALNALFDTFVNENLDLSPTFATSLGVDTGARAHQRSEIDESSLGANARAHELVASQLKRLQAFDRASVGIEDQVSYDVVLFTLKNTDADNRRYPYAGGAAGSPYVICQRNGLYSSIPSFLDNQHQIETKSDADAYLSRLEQFALRLDEEAEVVRHDIALITGVATALCGCGGMPQSFDQLISRNSQTSIGDTSGTPVSTGGGGGSGASGGAT